MGNRQFHSGARRSGALAGDADLLQLLLAVWSGTATAGQAVPPGRVRESGRCAGGGPERRAVAAPLGRGPADPGQRDPAEPAAVHDHRSDAGAVFGATQGPWDLCALYDAGVVL